MEALLRGGSEAARMADARFVLSCIAMNGRINAGSFTAASAPVLADAATNPAVVRADYAVPNLSKSVPGMLRRQVLTPADFSVELAAGWVENDPNLLVTMTDTWVERGKATHKIWHPPVAVSTHILRRAVGRSKGVHSVADVSAMMDWLVPCSSLWGRYGQTMPFLTGDEGQRLTGSLPGFAVMIPAPNGAFLGQMLCTTAIPMGLALDIRNGSGVRMMRSSLLTETVAIRTYVDDNLMSPESRMVRDRMRQLMESNADMLRSDRAAMGMGPNSSGHPGAPDEMAVLDSLMDEFSLLADHHNTESGPRHVGLPMGTFDERRRRAMSVPLASVYGRIGLTTGEGLLQVAGLEGRAAEFQRMVSRVCPSAHRASRPLGQFPVYHREAVERVQDALHRLQRVPSEEFPESPDADLETPVRAPGA